MQKLRYVGRMGEICDCMFPSNDLLVVIALSYVTIPPYDISVENEGIELKRRENVCMVSKVESGEGKRKEKGGVGVRVRMQGNAREREKRRNKL